MDQDRWERWTLDLDELGSRLKAASELEFHYTQRRVVSEEQALGSIPSAVLALFGYSRSRLENSPFLLFIRKTDFVGLHKGQMGFPGGRCEPGEVADPQLTALRETDEEVGIPPERIQIVGRLPELFTATGYLIYPFLGILLRPYEEVILTLEEREIAEATWISLQELSKLSKKEETLFSTPVFQLSQNRIWGATGLLTKNILDRLEQVERLLSL